MSSNICLISYVKVNFIFNHHYHSVQDDYAYFDTYLTQKHNFPLNKCMSKNQFSLFHLIFFFFEINKSIFCMNVIVVAVAYHQRYCCNYTERRHFSVVTFIF